MKKKIQPLLLREVVPTLGGDTLVVVSDSTGDEPKVIADGIPFRDCLAHDMLVPFYEYEVFHMGYIKLKDSGGIEILLQEQQPN